MANISLRGLDPETMTALRTRATREKISVNTLVLRLIDSGLEGKASKGAHQRYDDLDALAGRWSKQDAADFAKATAAFSDVDADLWK